MKVSVQTARDTLSELIDAAVAGEEVVIAGEGKAAVKLVVVASGKFKLGLLQGQLGEVPDFLEPMSEDDLRLWEGGL